MLSTGSHESKRQIANMRPGAQSGAELGAQAAPGKRRIQGAVRSEAAQLPFSRAKCPPPWPQVFPARRTNSGGAASVPGQAAGGCLWLTLLADVCWPNRSASAFSSCSVIQSGA